jgi:hypothetical protein
MRDYQGMTFDEFESYARKAIMAFAAVRKLVSERDRIGGPGLTAADRVQIEQLQEEAAVALGAIDHLIDLLNHICVLGQGGPTDSYKHPPARWRYTPALHGQVTALPCECAVQSWITGGRNDDWTLNRR